MIFVHKTIAFRVEILVVVHVVKHRMRLSAVIIELIFRLILILFWHAMR
jgi:hypothetical protein